MQDGGFFLGEGACLLGMAYLNGEVNKIKKQIQRRRRLNLKEGVGGGG